MFGPNFGIEIPPLKGSLEEFVYVKNIIVLGGEAMLWKNNSVFIDRINNQFLKK
jgi:hypothetical protein